MSMIINEDLWSCLSFCSNSEMGIWWHLWCFLLCVVGNISLIVLLISFNLLKCFMWLFCLCVQVVFEGVRGRTYRADIAIDDISILQGACPSSGLFELYPQSASVLRHCLWLPVSVCSCLWLPVSVCSSLWLSVLVCDCLFLSVLLCDCLFLSVLVCDCLFLSVTLLSFH